MMFFLVSFLVLLILQPLVYRLVGFLSFSSPLWGLRHGVKTRRLKRLFSQGKNGIILVDFGERSFYKGSASSSRCFFFIFKHSSLIQNLLSGHVVDCSPAWFQDLFLFSHRWTQQSADEAKTGVRVTGLLPKLHFTIFDLSV